MKYYSERKAEEFLEKFGFNVVSRVYVKKKVDISDALTTVSLPCVMKVGGEKIVHKNKIDGVRTNISTYSEALIEFNRMKKIKGADGVMFQNKIPFTKEFVLGVKKTEDFGHVVLFGSGGTDVEEKKDIAFRALPLDLEEAYDLVKSVEVTKDVGKKEGEKLANVIMHLGDLVRESPKISELDINPFVMSGDGPMILDARILFEWFRIFVANFELLIPSTISRLPFGNKIQTSLTQIQNLGCGVFEWFNFRTPLWIHVALCLTWGPTL